MKCPTCNKLEYTVSKLQGYSSHVVNECIRCNTIWIDKNGKADIIYINGDKNGF